MCRFTYALEQRGSRRTFENFETLEDLKKTVRYNGLPETLTEFDAGNMASEGYVKKTYQHWSSYAYPVIPELDDDSGTIAYIPSKDMFIRVEEGCGDQLLDEDIDAGYVDYANINVYHSDGSEHDGGILMLERAFKDVYPYGEELSLVADAVAEMFYEPLPRFILLRR